MCHRMNITHIGFGKCNPRTVSSPKHSFSGFLIVSIVISIFQMLMDQTYCFLCHSSGLFCSGAANICLYCMSQCIHTGSSCNISRKSYCLMIVEHRIARNQYKIIDRIFIMLFTVSDDRSQCGLTSSSCCSWNCDQKWKPLMYFEQTFHLLNALVGLYDPGTCSLGTIHGGSAAKCNDCLGSFCQIQLSGLLHIPDSGIGHSSVIDTIRNIVFRQGLLQK